MTPFRFERARMPTSPDVVLSEKAAAQTSLSGALERFLNGR
jgi:hypothetical protein